MKHANLAFMGVKNLFLGSHLTIKLHLYSFLGLARPVQYTAVECSVHLQVMEDLWSGEDGRELGLGTDNDHCWLVILLFTNHCWLLNLLFTDHCWLVILLFTDHCWLVILLSTNNCWLLILLFTDPCWLPILILLVTAGSST